MGLNSSKPTDVIIPTGATAPSVKNNSYRNIESQSSKHEVAINMPEINVKKNKSNISITIPKNLVEDPRNPSPTQDGGKRKTRKSKKTRKAKKTRKH
jgi:hypothetical protein